jgi:hypothetical protein
LYIVPRFWPEPAAGPVAVPAPPPVAATVTSMALSPLYAPDPQARRDLALSYELKAFPEKP